MCTRFHRLHSQSDHRALGRFSAAPGVELTDHPRGTRCRLLRQPVRGFEAPTGPPACEWAGIKLG